MRICGDLLYDHQVLDKMEKLCYIHCTCDSASPVTVVTAVKEMDVQFDDE